MLNFDHVSHHYGQQQALDEVTFAAASGEITCLIGPSGCGKTTLLRLAAGLMPLQSGHITLNREPLAKPGWHLPPEKRPVGLVFQEGALFPHLTVRQNVAFGLAGGDSTGRVEQLLGEVGLSALADRYPHSLSGGQRQRVSLARAIAPAPRALLFDEPYANLDMQRRRSLREQARQLIQQSGTVGIFVTHDPDEVMAIADQVVVLEQGQLLQRGSPRELYDAPRSLSVARLFGDAQGFPGQLAGDQLMTPFGNWPSRCLSQPLAGEGDVHLVVRPENLSVGPARAGPRVLEIRTADSADMLVIQGSGAGNGVDRDPRAAPLLYVRQNRSHGLKNQDCVAVLPQDRSVFAELV
ncbi:MAG: ABC transporter ATP-binding protein [Pseudomonadota bacterium]